MKVLLCLIVSLTFASTAMADTNQEAHQAEIYHSLAEKKAAGLAREIIERVTLSGLVEVEAGYESVEDPGGTDTSGSDIVLATTQLGIGVEVSETVSGDLILLYEEEPDSQVEVDEATLNFNNEKYFARVGRQYVPFGAFISHFISDPMLLDLGETQATAILGGVRINNAEFSLFAFNGDADKIGDDDHINDFGVNLTVTAGDMVEIGASYLSDLADSGAELTLDAINPDENSYSERAAGWSAYIVTSIASVEFSAEILAATDKLIDLGVNNDEPLAWNTEIAWGINVTTELAFRAEGSDEIADAPEFQYGTCLTKGIGENLSLSFEYLHGEFDKVISSALDTRDVITAQLAYEF